MPKRKIKIPAGSEPVEILHITDIHAGPNAYTDHDNKEKIARANQATMLGRLRSYVRALPKPPDYVVISGDMTNAGDPKGMEEVRDWLTQDISEGVLPSEKHVIVMPGNHDVDRMADPDAESDGIFDTFFKVFGTTFPHALISKHDPGQALSQLDIGKDVIGGITTTDRFGRIRLVSSWPFLLDIRKKLLIYAFNSSLSCGTYLTPDEKLKERLTFLEGFPEPALGHAKEIRKLYYSSLLIDAPLVGEPQLEMFRKTMEHLRASLGETFDHLTKIAALHHHVTHLWRQQLEVKKFETVIDAAQVKQALVEHRFDMVLHGHKHHNHVSLDSEIIPISDRHSLSPLCIVSGGTTGVFPRMGDKPTFKIISLKGGPRPRTDAMIREVPLLAGSPRNVMQNESRLYQVPLAASLGDLHDLSQFKSDLDLFAFNEAASDRLKDKRVLVQMEGKSQMPVPDPEIISEGNTYEFFRVLNLGQKRTFVDIFQADRRLGFRQKARIHWMLIDVKEFNEQTPSDVLLIIANLEATHFSRATEPSEITDSINELKALFEPAIRKKLLEIKVCNVAQEDVDRIGKKSLLDRKSGK